MVIEYQDTDGKSRTLPINIDTVPPTVQVDVPAHASRGRDTTPAFAGAYSDADSGLREDSFRLYVDNSNDVDETGGDDVTNELGVGPHCRRSGTDPSGYVANEPKPIRSTDEYKGYDEGEDQFGVLEHGVIYDLEDDDDIEHIEGDRHDDGSATGTFSDSVRIRITETYTDANGVEREREVLEYNNTIDFHALVADVAGNVGFSDSDDSGPRLINDYGKNASVTTMSPSLASTTFSAGTRGTSSS